MTRSSAHSTWVFPGGHIPPTSIGREPEMTSRDAICVLNTTSEIADIQLQVYYEDHDPVGPYHLRVAARRVRHVRVNDLIDPQPVPLGVPYGLVLHSSVPVIAQMIRVDSGGGVSTAVIPGMPSN